MTGAIDFHTHAFPDPIAKAAIPTLEQEGGIKAYLNSTVSALLDSMRIPVASGHLFRCKVGHQFRSNLSQAFRCKVVH